jgi:CCR4-NOT transcriptional regulation complex NOT5 subunit
MAYRSIKKSNIKLKITDEIYEKMQSRNQLWTREAFDQSEEIAGQFKDNIIYLCEKKGIKQKDMLAWLDDMGLKFRNRRLYEWGVEHAIYPSIIEITFFSKYLETDPGVMISKNLRESDRLKGISEH